MSPRHRLLALAGLAVPLAGCVAMSGNVKGNFVCSAPSGICAPSSVIDDRALALIAGTSNALPAGPYSPPGSGPAAIQVAGAGPVVRTNQKVLKIVFPAHVDAHGRYYEAAAIRTVVDQGVWVAGSETGAKTATRPAAPRIPYPSLDAVEADLGSAAGAAPLAIQPEAPQLASIQSGGASVALGQGTPAAPTAAGAAPSLTREALKAQVYGMLRRKTGAAAAAATAGSAAVPGVVPNAAPANKPASFSGVVED